MYSGCWTEVKKQPHHQVAPLQRVVFLSHIVSIYRLFLRGVFFFFCCCFLTCFSSHQCVNRSSLIACLTAIIFSPLNNYYSLCPMNLGGKVNRFECALGRFARLTFTKCTNWPLDGSHVSRRGSRTRLLSLVPHLPK